MEIINTTKIYKSRSCRATLDLALEAGIDSRLSVTRMKKIMNRYRQYTSLACRLALLTQKEEERTLTGVQKKLLRLKQNGGYLRLPSNSIYSHLNGDEVAVTSVMPDGRHLWIQHPRMKQRLCIQINEIIHKR